MIKNHAAPYEDSTLEKMLEECKYEREKNIALEWFQENVKLPTEDAKCAGVSRLLIRTSESTAIVSQVGVKVVTSSPVILTSSEARQLAGALLIAAERAEQES